MKNSIRQQWIIIFMFLTQIGLSQTVFRGIVLDKETNIPIANAKVGVVHQGVGEITDENGKFTYRKYHEILDNESILKVSAEGYTTFTEDVSVLRDIIQSRGLIYLSASTITKEERSSSKKVAVFWDASKKSRARDIKAEKAYLQSYLSSKQISEIQVTIFNERVLSSEIFSNKELALQSIETSLNRLVYEGYSDYDHIKYTGIDEVLLFTEHLPTVGKAQIEQETPFHVINYTQQLDARDYFKKICAFTSGDFQAKKPQTTRAIVEKDLQLPTISGLVTTSNKEVNYAMVVKEGSINEYYTNEAGNFKVPAVAGDKLTIYCLGHYPKKVEVTEKDYYEISLVPKAEILDEVLLEGKMSTAPKYAYNQKKQTDKIGNRTVPIRTIYKEDFNKGAIDIFGLINGWHGIRSYIDGRANRVTTLKGGCVRYIVDGVETEGLGINIAAIERITVYDGFGSVLPCPARIIITTRFHPDIIDQKLRIMGIDPLKNNNYTEEVPSIDNTTNTYFKETIISGKVLSNNVPIQNVQVLKKGTLKEYTTDTKGMFSLPASEGDILIVKHLGMYPQTVLVTTKKDYTISLLTKTEALGEIALYEKTSKQDVKYDSFDPTTKMEIVNGQRFEVNSVLFKEDINLSGLNIYEVITKSSGKIKFRNGNPRTFVYPRGGKDIPLEAIVDGTTRDVESVNPASIERVSVYIAPLREFSKIFITTRDHPDIHKKFQDEIDTRLKNNNYTETLESVENTSNSYFTEKSIKGLVRSKNGPLQNASIFKKGSLEEVVTNKDGIFSISVIEGDVLRIEHLGKYPKTVIITQEDYYEIDLITKTELLDTVALEKKKEENKEELVETAYGLKNRNAVGYKVENQAAQYIADSDVFFLQVIYKLPGVVIDPKTKTMFLERSFGTINEPSPIQFIVNDVPVTQQTALSLNPQFITNITILRSVASTLKYGSQAFGGVILVTTNNADFSSGVAAINDIRAKNNDYKEELPILNFDAVNATYIDAVTKEKSTTIKLKAYQKLKTDYIDKVDFYVDMTLYFQQIDAGVAAKVRSDFAQISGDNVKALRILAYLNEHAGEYLNAQKIYERILELAPSQAQSYRDVAMIYQETGEYNKSLELYINMLGGQIKGVDFTSLEVPISNELKRLVSLHKHRIDFNRLPNDWLAVDFNIDVRLTLDWSDPNAPFEFQFVDPERKFYTWQSTNGKEEGQEVNLSEEFIIDDAASGEWLVNVRYTGPEDEIHVPPYLKYTLYKDFGTPQEEKLVKLVRLDKQLDKVTLDSFVY